MQKISDLRTTAHAAPTEVGHIFGDKSIHMALLSELFHSRRLEITTDNVLGAPS